MTGRYSPREMKEIERDPERLRAYFWQVAMNAKRMARSNRTKSRRLAVAHPVTNYKPVFEEGHDLLSWADTLDRFSQGILDNIDLFVKTTLVHGDGQ